MGDETIRRVPFTGALNFRDIGGYEVAGGGTTRSGAVYRRPGAEALMSTPRWAMAQALWELDQAHGGIRQYLLGPGGMAPETLSALRANFVS